MKPYKNTFNEVDMTTTSKGNDVNLCCYNIIILIILTTTPLHVSMDFREFVSTYNNNMKNSISVRHYIDNLKDVNNRIKNVKEGHTSNEESWIAFNFAFHPHNI
jgi:hypothetical protein